jgi:uncharacterized protein (TIGR02145 family)
MKKALYFFIIVLITLVFGFMPQDQGGKKIRKVKIGKQIWMKENLNVDHYRNGDRIPQVQDQQIWDQLKTGAWCYYNNDSVHGEKYGKLYNWYAVNDPRGLAPKGWHIPTLKEFNILKATVNKDGNALKEIGEGHDSGKGTNKSGFSALLVGGRYYRGIFNSFGYTANFWTSTELSPDIADFITLSYAGSVIDQDRSYKYIGYSVRCVKN